MSIFDKNRVQEGPESITIKDKQLTCQHCGNDQFYIKHPAILFSGNLMNTHVTCFVCSECTHMHWFDSNK